MRKYVVMIALAVVAIAGSTFVLQQVKAQTSSSTSPTLTVSPAAAPLHKNTNLVIIGTGYKAKQEVNILFNDGFGSIGALEKPVKADDRGNFVTSWKLDRYTRGGILVEGVTNIMAADSEFNVLASAPVALANTGKDFSKWPSWAKTAFPKPKAKAKATPKPDAKSTPAAPAASPKPKSK